MAIIDHSFTTNNKYYVIVVHPTCEVSLQRQFASMPYDNLKCGHVTNVNHVRVKVDSYLVVEKIC
jgi:hypothetical protein